MRPLIVVTTTSHGGDYRVPQVMVGAPYLAAVQKVDGTPILSTPAHNRKSIENILDISHGLMLTGGEDVDPARYGQDPHPELGNVNPQRDRMELMALECALERSMPVLAICRGFQLLNVAMGGTLIQDIPSQRGGDIVHEQSAPVNDRWHDARVQEGSRLAQIFGVMELSINSFHHQAVDRVGAGLEPTVWAEDGLVEGFEATEYPWVFGVQWHPERSEADIPGDRRHPDGRLIWSFVDAARKYAEANSVQAPALPN
ncbi:MAG TPA: gamma-glutamyl-gamma-aminobutyrate hydrolase family protein [Longimicrobiaceae bacterium]|nr:gamma-glutamyl-gamma-aminobutyrate hydrolase family protein [Longimicrobiaceae bacterium]